MEAKKGFLEKMQDRWGVDRNGVFVILLVFTITGTSVALLRKPIFELFGFDQLNGFLYVLCYILVIFPLYQILLLIIGTLLGQHKFFLEFEKKMLRRMKIIR